MGRKWLCFLWAMVIVCEMGMDVRAEGLCGSITVQPQWCGTSVAGGSVSVQYVGNQREQGYVLTDGLADWQVNAQELENTQWIDWLVQHHVGKGISAPVGERGAVFSELQPGIYLIRQSETALDFFPFRPFLMTIPTEGNWDLAAKPNLIRSGESPQTGDHPAPIIGAMGIGLSAAVLMVLMDEHKK